ncbi:MAG: FeoA family protein [bacterium]
MTRLCDMQAGSTASLVKIGGEASFRRRLMELGLLPGTALRVVRRVQVGNLLEVEVRGCHLSLRFADSQELFVRAL